MKFNHELFLRSSNFVADHEDGLDDSIDKAFYRLNHHQGPSQFSEIQSGAFLHIFKSVADHEDR